MKRERIIRAKSCCDPLLAAVLLVLLLPLLLWLAVRIKRDSPGKVFYRQYRIGKAGKPFVLYKFRTMRDDPLNDPHRLTLPRDERVTPLGKKLRRRKLDELPQLWNVLRGEMFLIGPRPEQPFYVDRLDAEGRRAEPLRGIKPGIASLGVVRYGYAAAYPQIARRIRYENFYVGHLSPGLDLLVLRQAVQAAWKGRSS